MKNIFIFWVSSLMLAVPQGLSAQSDTTFVAAGNPIVKHKFIADPAAMVHDGKMYIYGGHDECPPPEEHYDLKEWCVFSSSDLKTWTEHAVPLKAKDFSWAKGEAWASQVIERDGKFYWYVTVEHKTIPGKSIGVAVSDSPTGPFVDARGSALITNDMTTDRSKSYASLPPSAPRPPTCAARPTKKSSPPSPCPVRRIRSTRSSGSFFPMLTTI